MKEKGMKKGCVSLYSWKKIIIIMYMNGLHCHVGKKLVIAEEGNVE